MGKAYFNTLGMFLGRRKPAFKVLFSLVLSRLYTHLIANNAGILGRVFDYYVIENDDILFTYKLQDTVL